MELNEVKSIWQSYDEKLQKSLKFNLHFVDMIQSQKIKSNLTPLLIQRIFELLLHTIVIVLLITFLFNNSSDWRYVISGISLLIFYAAAFSSCLQQISIIKRMDYIDDIVTTQSTLVILRMHMINFVRLAILCIPAFLAFPMVVSKGIQDLHLTGLSFMDIRAGYSGNWWTIQLVSSLILIPVCIWLYSKLSYKNIHIKWVKTAIHKIAGGKVTKSIEFINELESLKRTMI